MAQVNTATFINRYNNATTGLFKDNTTGDIEALDTRDLVKYLADSYINFLSDVVDEDNMASNSAVLVPTQQSVKAYSDTKWPLSGIGDLTAAVTIDGNNFDLIFGSPNRLDDFQIYADAGILFDVNDGVDASSLSITPNFLGVSVDVFDIFNSDATAGFYADGTLSGMYAGSGLLQMDVVTGTVTITGAHNQNALAVEDDMGNRLAVFGESGDVRVIGFFGVTPVIRQVVPTGSTTDTVITALQAYGIFSQS